ncbi:hypothetical protein [Mesorhizobium australicum]|uniref:hypothetical protein n=1 Tax=Mesorhizobium australicum TaxID=536018 RepID=UPI00333BE0B6
MGLTTNIATAGFANPQRLNAARHTFAVRLIVTPPMLIATGISSRRVLISGRIVLCSGDLRKFDAACNKEESYGKTGQYLHRMGASSGNYCSRILECLHSKRH